MQNMLIAGGTGFIGRSLIPALKKSGAGITVVTREKDSAKKIFGEAVSLVSWDELNHLDAANYTCVINLSGHNIADGRWTDKTKQLIIESRVHATKRLIEWMQHSSASKPHLYNASAIGIYGLQPITDAPAPRLVESTEIETKNFPDFVTQVGVQWEAATQCAADAGIPVTLMRFGVVLKRGEGMLKKLEIPFKFGLGSIVGSGKQILSWIHIDDLVSGIQFLIQHPEIVGPVNLCAPTSVTQQQFAVQLATQMKRPLWMRMPEWSVKLLFGQMGEELLLSGQNVYPERMLHAGFVFDYPEVDIALKQMRN